MLNLPTPLPSPAPSPAPRISPSAAHPRQRNRAATLVDAFQAQVRGGELRPGDKLPTEAALMARFGVSRTVVREALSMLQASRIVQTRHGIGTFVMETLPDTPGFSVSAAQMATLHDVIAVLELRIALESEAASLAATRRTLDNLARLGEALAAVSAAMDAGQDAVEADFRFHLEIASATQNPHFSTLLLALGAKTIIPRARLEGQAPMPGSEDWNYLQRVQAEHQSIYDAIAAQDAEAARTTMRMHLVNSRERRRRTVERASGASSG